MREIVLDTETTGFEPGEGHRLVEIGCVEIFNRFPTGNSYHAYINPERDMPQDAFKVHGLSAEFLRDKPVFSAIALEFTAFIGDSPLVIHNASFDTKFLNFELKRLSHPELRSDRIVDTLALARRKHPGASCTLDALCDRYHLDRSRRVKHGALLDAELLAEVYSELLGGKQAKFDLSARGGLRSDKAAIESIARRVELPARLTETERQNHATFVETLGDTALWKRYIN